MMTMRAPSYERTRFMEVSLMFPCKVHGHMEVEPGMGNNVGLLLLSTTGVCVSRHSPVPF